MNSKDQSPVPARTEITSTAFRLPTELLRIIDRWCDANDVTRSQFFRRSIIDRVNLLGIAGSAELNADQLNSSGVNSAAELVKGQPRQWSPETFARLERRH
jgi:hypothetical protein